MGPFSIENPTTKEANTLRTPKQVKPGFPNYQPQPKCSWALSKIEGKGKLGKTKDFWKRSEKQNNSEKLEVSENLKLLKI